MKDSSGGILKKPTQGVRTLIIMLIIYGVINLLGAANYKDIKMLCTGLPSAVIFAIYIFGVAYGVSCIFCGTKMLRLEDWARKTAIVFTFISLLLGLLLMPLAQKNLSVFYPTNIAWQDVSLGVLKKITMTFNVIFVAFELAFIYFFTRPRIKEHFS